MNWLIIVDPLCVDLAVFGACVSPAGEVTT